MDSNGDRKIDIVDFTEFASQWLNTDCNDCGGADFTCDNNVDISDVLVMMQHWLGDYSLKGHWKLDENGADNSYFANHGALNGSPSWDTTGKIGSSIVLNGTEDYIQIETYRGVLGTKSRTVAAWIKTTNANGTILSWGDPAAGKKWKFQMLDTFGITGALQIEVWDGHIVGSTDLRGGWHHVAAVLVDDGSADVSEIELYVDGILEIISDVEAMAIDTGYNNNVLIGTLLGGAGSLVQFFDGQIDDVRIYDRALDQLEIQTLASMGN